MLFAGAAGDGNWSFRLVLVRSFCQGLTIHSSRSRFAARLNSGVRRLSMFLRYSILSLVLFGCTSVAATRDIVVPSEPATWNKDFTALVRPTPDCPGGTVEQLRKRMSVSEAYSPQAYEAAHQTSLGSLRGLAATDRLHEF